MIEPRPAHRYQVAHAELLRRSFHALTGRDLLDPTLSPEAAADALFHAPFVVLSHDAAPAVPTRPQALPQFERELNRLMEDAAEERRRQIDPP
jgi:hypothetical protein